MLLYTDKLTILCLGDIADEMGIELYNFDTMKAPTRGKFKRERKFSFLLRPVNGSDAYRARGQSGKRIWAVTWEGHRKFMVELFVRDPDAILDSALARYRGRQEFLDLHMLTGSDMNRGFRAKVMGT